MRLVRWLAWSVGILFLIGTVLQLVDFLNLYVTPPDIPDSATMVDVRLALIDYRAAIWPIFFLGNLSFGVAFVAVVGLGIALASWLASGEPQRIVISWSLIVAGVLGAVAQFILIGAVQPTIDVPYCDCVSKETEVISQIWAQMLVEGASAWLLNGALVLSGIGVLAVRSAFGPGMPAAWDIVSWLTAIGLIASVLLGVLQLGPPELGLYLQLLVSGVLVPIWTIWLGASLRAEPRSEPATFSA
jgi:hypothetical protein